MLAGEVTGTKNIGGLVGDIYRQSTYNTTNQMSYIQITNCYGVGKVTGTTNAGGLIGYSQTQYNGTITITNSYWDTVTTTQPASAGGTAYNTTQMKTQTSYTSWDFTNVWRFIIGNYPKLTI